MSAAESVSTPGRMTAAAKKFGAAIESTKVQTVVCFIPALNEEEKLADVISEIRSVSAGSESRGYRMKIVVVDDGSTDRTRDVAMRSDVDRVISHPRNLGLGAATRSGLLAAREMDADVAFKMDADFQHDPSDIEKVIRPALDGEASIVYGSRFAGNIHYRMPIVRFVGNRFFTWLMRVLTGWPITDAQTGLMVYSRDYLSDFTMPGNYNPPQQTLLDAYHRNLTYAEVPVEFHARTTGKSFVSFKYPIKAIPQMVRTIVMVSPLKVFAPLGVLFSGSALIGGAVEAFLYAQGSITDIHDATLAVLFLFGVQCLFFGLLADLMIHRRASNTIPDCARAAPKAPTTPKSAGSSLFGASKARAGGAV